MHKDNLPFPFERVLPCCPTCFETLAFSKYPRTREEALTTQVLTCKCGEIIQAAPFRNSPDRPVMAQTVSDSPACGWCGRPGGPKGHTPDCVVGRGLNLK